MGVGDYVRTECGIAKIKSFETKNKEVIELDKDIMICNMDCYRNNCTINQVIKSSPNIIDLIEVGDYVNGCLVTNKRASTNERLSGHPKQIFILKQEGNYYDGHFEWLGEENIKSIVTKDQFENCMYIVGE